VTTPSGVRTTSEQNLRPDLDDLLRRWRNLSERHRHYVREFEQAVNDHGGFQVQYLDMAVEQMNPEPTEVHSDDEEHAWMGQMFRRVAAGWNYWEDAATGKPLNERGREVLHIHVERMRQSADRVYEDLRMRMATAPPLPAPVPSYPERVANWAVSPAYALLGGPCLAGIITAAATGTGTGVGVYVLLAIAFALAPPAAERPPALTFTATSLTFAAVTTVVVVAALIAVSFIASVIAFLALAGAYMLGQGAGPTAR
jgi:hypothetical protein